MFINMYAYYLLCPNLLFRKYEICHFCWFPQKPLLGAGYARNHLFSSARCWFLKKPHLLLCTFTISPNPKNESHDFIITLMEKHQPGQMLRSLDNSTVDIQIVDTYIDDSSLALNEAGVRHFNGWNKKREILESKSGKAFQEYYKYLFLSRRKPTISKC